MIEQFSKADFEAYLSSAHSPFTPLGLIDGEYTYELPLDNQVSITIRSSVKSNGLSADVGKDSIRCWLVFGDKSLGSKVSKWTTRQTGWQDRLSENIKQLALWRALAGDCPSCGRPKGIFKARTEANKGRPFTRCREHNGFVWLDKPIEASNIYFSEASYGNSKESVLKQVAYPKERTANEPISAENVMQSDDSSDIFRPDGVDSEKYNDLVCLQKLPEKTNLQVRDDIYFSEDSYDNSEKVAQQVGREVACAKKSAKGSDIGTAPTNDVRDKNNSEGHLGNRELGSRQSMLQELPKGPSAIEVDSMPTDDDIILEPYRQIEEESYDGSNIGQMDVGAYSAKPQKTNSMQDADTKHTLQNLKQENKIENLPQMLSSKKTAPNTQQRQAISEESYDINERDTTEAKVSHFSGQEKHGDSVRQNSDVSRTKNNAANTKEVSEGSHDLSELLEKIPNSQQKQAIEADINASLRVLAGPGSGKTFVIEHRYKFLVENGIDPDKIIVCTFGKQSATDMGQRIQKTCPQANLEQICTINALCHRLLTKWYPDSRWYKWRGPKDWQIKKTLEGAIGPIWQESEKPGAQEIYNLINTSKYLSLTTDDSYLWFTEVLGQRRGAWLYEIRSKFDAWLNRNRFLTFADQLFLVEQQLRNDTSFRTMIQEKFSHVIIDEMQDTSSQAIRILVTISLELGQNTVYENEAK